MRGFASAEHLCCSWLATGASGCHYEDEEEKAAHQPGRLVVYLGFHMKKATHLLSDAKEAGQETFSHLYREGIGCECQIPGFRELRKLLDDDDAEFKPQKNRSVKMKCLTCVKLFFKVRYSKDEFKTTIRTI